MDRRIIMHVDVNSAFLSWSAVYRLQHGDPVDLREIPSIVGGSQATRHGIVLARSIPAKKYAKTGEPVVDALKKCPKLVVVPPDYYLYMKCSSAMLEILRDYTDCMQVFSIDECFLDLTGMRKLLGKDVIRIANDIKDRIKATLGFTVSVGISTNKLLSKQASEFLKPDGVSTCYPEEIKEKLWPLPVRELYMVGQATELKLQKMGLFTIGDLANIEPEFLRYKFKSWGNMLYAFANGIEESPVKPGGAIPYIKGIGNSTTIHFDVDDKYTAHKVILSLCETVCMRLRHGSFCCGLVSVTIRTDKLISYSHQHRLIVPTDCTNVVYEECCRLFDVAWKGEPIRGLGVRVSDLCTNDFIQLSFLEKDFERKRILDKTIDEVRIKHGACAVFRSTFLHSRLSPIVGGISEESNLIMSSML